MILTLIIYWNYKYAYMNPDLDEGMETCYIFVDRNDEWRAQQGKIGEVFEERVID